MIGTVPPTDRDVHQLFVFTYTACLRVSNCHIYSFVFVIVLPVCWAVRTEYSDGTDPCICELCYKYSFPRPSHSADLQHLLTLAMSWERYTCTNTGHLSVPHRLFVNVTHVKGIDTVFLLISRPDLSMRSHDSFSIWQAGKRTVCGQYHSVRRVAGQVRTHHNDQPLLYWTKTVCGAYRMSEWPRLPPVSEHEGTVPRSQQRATGSYLEPDIPRTCLPYCPIS